MLSAKEIGASSSIDSQTVQQLKDGLAQRQNALSVLINLVKDHIPNANLSGVLNNLNLQVSDNISMVRNNSPLGNQRSTSESHNNNGNCS
ncbi:hypothetical protein L2E82_51406 [Cichorium intybus]|nr:hypothetical protein L2E82_51406 [Cichorium intybus]